MVIRIMCGVIVWCVWCGEYFCVIVIWSEEGGLL